MATRHERTDGTTMNTADLPQAHSSKKVTAFRGHLTVYLCVGLFLLTLNLLTSPFELWFYWPLFFWGWALVFQAVATYGADAPIRVLADLRAIVPWLPNAGRASADPRPTPAGAPFAAWAFASAHERIERLKDISLQIPPGPVRDQAERLGDTAERIVAAMATDRADAETVGWFDEHLLAPAESLLERYGRLVGRGVSGADDTLRRVEEHDLPLLQDRFDALYDRLHRGEIVDLAVASEMLDFEPPVPPPSSLRRSR